MHWTRQIIGILSLALASLGPIPLWLHEITAHARHTACGCQAEDKPLIVPAECARQHGHATAAEQPLPSAPASQLDELHEHDCALCYQLTQSGNFAVEANLSESQFVDGEHSVAEPVYLVGVENPHRPRGPPCQ